MLVDEARRVVNFVVDDHEEILRMVVSLALAKYACCGVSGHRRRVGSVFSRPVGLDASTHLLASMFANIRVGELLRHDGLFSFLLSVQSTRVEDLSTRSRGERMYGLAVVLIEEKKMHQQAVVERALSEADQRVQMW